MRSTRSSRPSDSSPPGLRARICWPWPASPKRQPWPTVGLSISPPTPGSSDTWNGEWPLSPIGPESTCVADEFGAAEIERHFALVLPVLRTLPGVPGTAAGFLDEQNDAVALPVQNRGLWIQLVVKLRGQRSGVRG